MFDQCLAAVVDGGPTLSQHRANASRFMGRYQACVAVIIEVHSKQDRFLRRIPSVPLPCNPRRTLTGLSWGCMVIVINGSFKEPLLFRVYSIGPIVYIHNLHSL